MRQKLENRQPCINKSKSLQLCYQVPKQFLHEAKQDFEIAWSLIYDTVRNRLGMSP